jgi:protein FrlC
VKLSLSTFVYFRYSLIEAIRRTAAHGYDAVEVWGGRPHAYCDDMDTKRIAEVRTVIDDCGLEISNFIPAQFRYPVNIAIDDEQIRKGSVAYLKKNIDVAAELDAPYVSLCPGFSVAPQSQAEGWNAMLESLRELMEHAKGMPLTLLLEPAHRMESDLVITVDDGLRVLNELGSGLGLLPDTGHLFISHESLSDAVEKMSGITCHWHIDDNLGVTDDHMVPGEGKIQYEVFLKKLVASGYGSSLAIELGFQYTIDPDIAVRKSLMYLREELAKVSA